MTAKVIICLDGCAPDYLAGSETPNLDAIAREGFHTIGAAVVHTVTDVNNTSVITASLPETHGITSSYFIDPQAANRSIWGPSPICRSEK